MIPDTYDTYFRRYGERYLPQYDWRWFKAQAYQESRMDPNAVSPVGAQGVMQIMPDTWTETAEAIHVWGSPFSPKANIEVGIYYMQRMVDFWTTPRPLLEKLELAFASYNAGAGNVLKAQTKSGGKLSWTSISPHLEDVTGTHAEETLTYVENIKRWYNELVHAFPPVSVLGVDWPPRYNWNARIRDGIHRLYHSLQKPKD